MSYLSHADLGGQPAVGAIVPEPEGELFHADWEPRVLALTLAMGATRSWNIDASRAARETLPDYAESSYYQIWLKGLEKLMLQRGLVQADELAQGHMLHPALPIANLLRAAEVAPTLARGSPTARPAASAARFQIGQAVSTRAASVDHHSRLPGYVQGRRGVIERIHGCHVFAESHAQGLGEQPQWLYTVVFDGTEVWGESGSSDLTVSIDAWESTLEPA
ncbi:MAG: nitrile hydratase subunit beta [Ideonella sp.]